MLFNSIEFAIFLPVVFLLYWLVFRKSLRGQNLFIVAVSYLFYGWWDWRFLFLIAFTSLCSWGSGLLIDRFRHRPAAKAVHILNIVLNLTILGIFKYYDFFVTSFAKAFLHGQTDGLLLNVVLPVGISFYTFQALSYSIDVYREKLEPTRDIVQFFAFVSFFPQLVAGPIERATNLLPQFAFQIYGDFSGYSDIAIGTSKLFGIKLMRNINNPYFSRDIAEFWRRWHISLTTWFRDYVYIPLGAAACRRERLCATRS